MLGRDLGSKAVANLIKGKTPAEIRSLFKVVNEFTPEEEVSACLIASLKARTYINFFNVQAQIKKENELAEGEQHAC